MPGGHFPGFRGKRAAALPPEKASLPAGPLEAFGGAGDDLVLDAERQAEVAGAAETGTGHGEDAFVKELVDEGHVVAAGSLREEVKRAFGHLEFIAPVKEGTTVGEICYVVDGEIWRRERLYAAWTVEAVDLSWCGRQILKRFLVAFP